jgi:hypothetical protein
MLTGKEMHSQVDVVSLGIMSILTVEEIHPKADVVS